MASVVGTQSASAFASTLSTVLSTPPLSRADTDRAVQVARSVVDRGGVSVSEADTLLISRYLLRTLGLSCKSG